MNADLPPPRRVLIIKPSSLGDVITGLPVLRGLRRSFPNAVIAWLVVPGCAEVLDGQPGLDEVILFDRGRYGRLGRSLRATSEFVAFCRDLRGRRFDWVIDLQGLFRSGFLARVTGAPVRAGFADGRELAPPFYTHRVRVSAAHTVDRNVELARALGADARGDDLVLSVTPEARRSADAALARSGVAGSRYVVLVPGTRRQNKAYPPRNWRKVIAELSGEVPVVLVGTADEGGLCAELAEGRERSVVNLAGRTTLPELVAVIASAGAVVCSDSAAGFIATAVGVPFVALLGPTRPERTGPYGGGGRALAVDLPCIGCLKRRCRHATCMQLIAPSAVAAAARDAIAREPGTGVSTTPSWSPAYGR